MHTQNLDISVLNKSIEGLLNAYSKDIKVKTFPEELSKKYILKISKTIEDLYKTKGNDPYFRSSFENFLIELMEKERGADYYQVDKTTTLDWDGLRKQV